MARSGLLKGETISKLLFSGFLILSPLYIFSMFIYPLVVGGGSWKYLHEVFMDWQSLNVGVLALISSIIALYITRYHEIKQRQRDFIAARSFLPEALSELLAYLRTSSEVIIEALERDTNVPKTPLTKPRPELPSSYRETFSRCISLSEPDVSKYLSHILVLLQVHHARVTELIKSFHPDSLITLDRNNLISYIYSLAEVYALISKSFNFARGLEDTLDTGDLTVEDFNSAYHLLDIWRLDESDDIEQFTDRVLANRH